MYPSIKRIFIRTPGLYTTKPRKERVTGRSGSTAPLQLQPSAQDSDLLPGKASPFLVHTNTGGALIQISLFPGLQRLSSCSFSSTSLILLYFQVHLVHQAYQGHTTLLLTTFLKKSRLQISIAKQSPGPSQLSTARQPSGPPVLDLVS